jgi:hypothetical protein
VLQARGLTARQNHDESPLQPEQLEESLDGFVAPTVDGSVSLTDSAARRVATVIHNGTFKPAQRFPRPRLQSAPTRPNLLPASMIEAVGRAQLEPFRTPGAGAQSLEENRPSVDALDEGRADEAAAAVANHLTPVFAFSPAPEGEES